MIAKMKVPLNNRLIPTLMLFTIVQLIYFLWFIDMSDSCLEYSKCLNIYIGKITITISKKYRILSEQLLLR